VADYTILLIDYEPRSIERTKLALEGAGFGVELATDGQAGFKMFEELRPDMVLTEAMIPKMHGFELCQEIKKTPHGKNTPVVIITAVYKGRKYSTQAFHIYGCDEYIEKPVDGVKLVTICRKMLNITGKMPEPEPAVELVEEPEPSSETRADSADVAEAAAEVVAELEAEAGSEMATEIEEVVELPMESEESEIDPEFTASAEDEEEDVDLLPESDPEQLIEAENEIVACLDALLPGEDKKADAP